MKITIDEIRAQLLAGKQLAQIPLKVTFYLRVSTDHEEQHSSLVNQRSYFEAKIRATSAWKLVPGYCDEAKSGTSVEKRFEFLHMIEDAKAGEFDLILTKEVSRFARDTLDSIRYTRELINCHVGVFFEDIGLNTMEPDSEFRLAIMASVAQEESRKLSERVRFGYARGAERGIRHGAAAPLGYQFHNVNNGYVIDEAKAEIVRYVFSQYARGELGTRRIANDLAEMGYLNEAGNPYHPSTIRRIIENPVYWGNIVNGKYQKPSFREAKKIRRPYEEWILHYDPERVPPLISRELWEQANRVLTERGQAMKGANCSAKAESGCGRYIYSSRILCAEHGCYYHHAVGKWRAGNIEKQVEYWRCSLYKKYGKSQCESPLLYTDRLNSVMHELFAPIIPILKENVAEAVECLLNTFGYEDSGDMIKRLEREKDALEKRREKLFQGWMKELITDQEFRLAAEALESAKKKLNECYGVSKRQNLEQIKNRLFQQAELSANLGSDAMLETLVRRFVEKIIVKRSGAAKSEYLLEIRIAGTENTMIVDSSLCERRHLSRDRHIVP